jgi:hypothetical protein
MPSMSPRTQQFQATAGAGVDQTTQLFEQGFSQMAHNILMSKLPDIVQDVVTFKILDTDVERGMGVGAFIVMRNDDPLYIPVVMSENNIKPLELVYHKALNIFLPLSKQWLEELDKTSLTSMGKGVKTPETLYSDVDIRNIVVPPLTGRFSYAAWAPVIHADVAKVLNKDTIEKVASEPTLALLDFLTRAPNRVKTAFTRVLEKNPKTLKTAARIYGVKALTAALRHTVEKTAAKQHHGGALWIADKDTKATEFKRIFGENAAEAYSGVRLKGYAAKDERKERNLAVREQTQEAWTEPNQPGVYILFNVDGTERPALVMPNPIDLFHTNEYDRHDMAYGRSHNNGRRKYTGSDKYLAVFANGNYLQAETLAGRSSSIDEISGSSVYRNVFGAAAGEPRQGKGVFIRQRGATIQATCPLEIKSMSTGSDGVRRMVVSNLFGYREKTLVTQPGSPLGQITTPRDSGVAYLPHDFMWVPLKECLESRSFFRSVQDLAMDAYRALAAVGAKKIAVKNASHGMFSINGALSLERVPALKKLATDYVLPVDVAEKLLEKASTDRRVDVWIVSGEKLAQAQMKLGWPQKKEKEGGGDSEKKDSKEPAKKKPEGGGGASGEAPSQDPGMDPSMGGDPSMGMAPPAPPPPSPTDMAAAEMDQHIQQEMQKLVEKQQMLQALTMRANEIAGGAPMLPTVQNQMMGAPPASANLATGQPMPGSGMDPMAGGSMGGGMDPMAGGSMGGSMDPMAGGSMDPMAGGGMGGDPSMMAAPGGALPQDMGGEMGGMDPSMSGDPSMMQPPPMAMMGVDGPNDASLDSEVNPQFLDQAAALNSDDVFDAAAVASLAQSPAVKEMVSQYLPNLEKALDNIARVQLSLWMQEPELKTDIGEQAFGDLEESLRSTFKRMGDLVLKLSQGSHAIKDQYESAHP